MLNNKNAKISSKKKQKQEEVKEPEIKRQAAFNLNLTRFELLHLRDLMGVLLPPTGAQTLSQALASTEDRSLIESLLWEKVTRLCIEASLPVDAEAPDYIVAPVSPPAMGVFQINQDLQSGQPAAAGFLPSDDDGEEEGG